MHYQPLYDWYATHKRALPWRETTDPYAIWLSEVILQQTRVAQGIEYYYRFTQTFPSVDDLARAEEQTVMRLWQGLGYYSRARNLHKAAQMIVGQIGHFPATFDELRKLPGVGDYTAGAIASFAYDLSYPALDGNVYRVLSRLHDCSIPFDTTEGKKHFHHLAEQVLDTSHPRLFNSAIMELGALHCVPQNPDCTRCPFAYECAAFAHHTVELLPVRKPRPKITDRFFNYYIPIIEQSDAMGNSLLTFIHYRTDKDIWHHLYEFPLKEDDHLYDSQRYTDFTHILSHQRIHARFHIWQGQKDEILARLRNTLNDTQDYKLIKWEELDDYALSRLTLKALERLNIN